MNIIEAFQMGGRVKRSGWDEYYTPSELLATRNLLPNAILADDWEVEERDVSITSSQFDSAWDRASYAASISASQREEELFSGHYIDALYSSLKKELGL